MFKNYFKIAFRNLWRNKTFSFINISGLAIGIATCLIILLFVINELGYDRFNEKSDRMYRVTFKVSVKGNDVSEPFVMPPTAAALKRDYPEVEQATRLRNYGIQRIDYGDRSFKEDALAFVDPDFFDVFTLPVIKGNTKTVLAAPNTIVITQALANKYFGNEDPIGKVLTLKYLNASYKVTGVISKVPNNSHFHFDMFASMTGLEESKSDSWMTSEYYTYLVLPKKYDVTKLQAKMPQVVDKYMSAQMLKSMGMTAEEFRKKGNSIGFFLQPLTDIHLHSNFAFDLSPSGDIRYIYIFSAIALFMLLIACINFMNLSTAGASKRAREVGIRKVMGSMKGQLVRQFLLESLLLTLVAMALAVFIIQIALPAFNILAGKELTLSLATTSWLLPGLLLIALLTGIIAGSYPAFYLSSFKPVTVLKGKFTAGKKSIGLRSGLVVFQFFISITLIISTTVVYNQLSYIQHKKLGYDKDNVLILPQLGSQNNTAEVFRQQLLKDPRILHASVSGYLPAGPSNNNNFFIYPGSNSDQMIKSLRFDVDQEYISTLGMEISAGRNFSKNYSMDSSAVILNETAVKEMGLQKNPVGQTITHTNNDGKVDTYHVIGVVKDFHFRSMHTKISPLVMVLGDGSGNMILKVKATDISILLSHIKTEWTSLKTETPFSFSFMDDRLNNTYKSEQKVGTILGIFSGLTIFVACLGLFGLAMFTTEQRNKEIGVRKVLGANVLQIVRLLSKDFIRLVIIASVIAFPLSWWIMQKWSQDFAYRAGISWWIFIAAGCGTLLIALCTISYQAIKAAIANPVDSLRNE